jgi:hypothetical protein
MSRPFTAAVVAATLALSACGAAGSPAAESPVAPPTSVSPEPPLNPAAVVEGKPYRPSIDPADFVDVIDNPYLPWVPGTTWVYEGTSGTTHERNEVTVTDQTKVILGVTTTVVHDQVFAEGKLSEDTYDWYAQDRAGNVWYLGEDTKEYENGKVVSTHGSWEAGVDGAQPGIVMLAEPRVGERYRQEYLKGEAEDQGRIHALGESVHVPAGSYEQVLVTEDTTPLEPKVLEHKFFAPGVGVVMEQVLRGGHEINRLVEFTGPTG